MKTKSLFKPYFCTCGHFQYSHEFRGGEGWSDHFECNECPCEKYKSLEKRKKILNSKLTEFYPLKKELDELNAIINNHEILDLEEWKKKQ